MMCEKITPPRIYGDWVEIMDIIKSKINDADALKAMQAGKLEWQLGVSERFTKNFSEMLNYRMNKAITAFEKESSLLRGQESGLVRVLLALRKEFSYLVKLTDITAIPQEYRLQFTAIVVNQADKVQASLEASAKNDRSGKLANIIKNNKVNNFCEYLR